jgi:hypothetical protein
MKKAILIICVLSVLALLAVPVMAEVLFGESGLDQLAGSRPRPPGKLTNLFGSREAESPALIAWGGCRPSKSPG